MQQLNTTPYCKDSSELVLFPNAFVFRGCSVRKAAVILNLVYSFCFSRLSCAHITYYLYAPLSTGQYQIETAQT
ncbi:hypothetical protein Cob_v008286 [Colletotrichum orbiculare MAFF 240422]|uniref:Uncharacterized protein n=1 Tax=Colletotrichum orbiculare (strain 104-T / ATCC 96160 / CBS 514.97 / LARS 414 / MAFF 240422) TaxID=1213857 RepID=A0A484FM41_COLOR|nr:hypothetical protein Cob_v008286 [Colletotrichum orbiculare MAFF 240422]